MLPTKSPCVFFHCLMAAFWLMLSSAAIAQSTVYTPPPYQRSSFWISPPATNLQQYGVYHFRKNFFLKEKPASFRIKVSGDQHYRLYVNGRSVATGPARSDVAHWTYQTTNVAADLQTGNNTLAAVVWNDGEHSAWSQFSLHTGFFIEATSVNEQEASTNNSWKVMENMAYSPVASIAHITGAFQQVYAQRYPWGWQQQAYDDSKWPQAVVVNSVDMKDNKNRTMLPSLIPLPEEKLQRVKAIRRSNGLNSVTDNFIKGTGGLKIHPWADVTILMDQETLTNAYISLQTSGGRGAKITVTYAEALYDSNGNKGNRNEIKGKTIKGNEDIFLPDGGYKRLFTTLYYRTYRYVQLHIENHQEELVLEDFYGRFTGYPFKENARFKSNDSSLQKIWETGWRTARLCAFDTYMDCPYYEQLQYVGDTRIQALISLYVSGDDRLMKNAIQQMQYSILPEGLTQSRYPSNNVQVIPPFSLLWIAMIHDYWMHKKDEVFVQQFLPDIKKIITWHKAFINEKGMLNKMPHWNFVDWPKEWPWTGIENESGVPAGTITGNSSILTLQYVMALQKAAALITGYDDFVTAGQYITVADTLKKLVYKNCWSSSSNLLADTPDKNIFSQHAQALAVLTSTLPVADEKTVLTNTISNSSLIQCTYYYRFYLLQALKKAGLANLYLSQLAPWKNMIDIGLSTFAEAPEPTRSDCHAWSASPCYDLLATVAGIVPASAGFSAVRIQPHLGTLTFCESAMPHPNGMIEVSYKKNDSGRWQAAIELPKDIRGKFIWQGKTYSLKGGRNRFVL